MISIDDVRTIDTVGSDLFVMCRVLKRVIVENFSFCNRTCEFCPNSVLDRRSSKTYLSDELYLSIVNELSQGHFNHSFAFGRYHEPLADEIVFERIAIARRHLPHAHLFLNTNGDYLIPGMLDRLALAGLSEIKIVQYLPNGTPFTCEDARLLCERLIRRLCIRPRRINTTPQECVYYEIEPTSDMAISVRCENYRTTGCDRGGLIVDLRSHERDKPCYAPYFELNIDYDGSVIPCCNMRSDSPIHKDYILGNVKHDNLTTIFFSSMAATFRHRVSSMSNWPQPCRTCQYNWPTSASMNISENIHETI